MVQAAPNKLQARFCQELARQISLHRVVLLFDPAEQLRSLLDALATSQPSGTRIMNSASGPRNIMVAKPSTAATARIIHQGFLK